MALADPCKGITGKWTTLTLKPTDSIQRALLCAAPGFKLTLADGVYAQSFIIVPGFDGWDIGGGSAANVKLDGKGGCTVAQNNAGGCDTRLAWRKGLVLIQSPGTLHDLELTGGGTNATDGHDGQAGAYIDTPTVGLVTFRKLMVRGNQMGLFSNTGAVNASAVVELCDFVNNSTDWGSHDTYFGGLKEVTYRDNVALGSLHGNNFKTRAVPLVHAYGGFNKSNEGRWIECADGCSLDIHGGTYVGNTCCQNVFGNGTESNNTGPGNTTMENSIVWLGRWSDLSNAGTFKATNVTLLLGANGSGAFNDKGGDLTGLVATSSLQMIPVNANFVSGAK